MAEFDDASGDPSDTPLAIALSAVRRMAQTAQVAATAEANELARANAQLRAVLASISDNYCTVDRDWRVTDLNARAEQWFGRAAEAIVGRDLREVLRPDDAVRLAIEEALEIAQPAFREAPSVFHPGRWVEIQVNPSADGVSVFFQDVTERRTATLDARRAEEALRDALERLLSVQDEERKRIALELHDSTGQHLVALSLGLARLQQLDLPDAVGGVLEDMRLSVEEAQREIRTLSYLLHPPALERDGLAATLRSFVHGFARRAELKAELRLNGPLDQLSPAVQRTVFRVLQEALINVHRHAAASKVRIGLDVRTGQLRLRVADDGRGFSSVEALNDARLGVGIPGMRARVRRLGGDLAIREGSPGTVVVATIPAAEETAT